MDDLISRRAAIDAVSAYLMLSQISRTIQDSTSLQEVIENVPAVQPERKTGKWIERNPQNSDKCRLIECSECGNAYIVPFNVPYEHWIDGRNFCIRCGADLRNVGGK